MSSTQGSSIYLEGCRLYIVIASLFFGTFLIALDTNILNVAVPKISTDFHALDDVAWYGTSYLVGLTAFQPIYGSLYKFFNTTIIYRLAIVVFEVGSIICATSTSSSMFIIGRAIAGLGAAGLFQGALSIISQVVTLKKRPMYMGVVVSVFAIATSAGPPLGGAFTEHSTWRWCFWINVPIGFVVLVALSIFLRIKDADNENRRLSLWDKLSTMDPVGCILFIGAIVCLLLALQWGGQTKPWKSATIIGLLIGAFALALLFVGVQWFLQDRALIPPRVFRMRSIWTGVMVLFFLGATTYLNVFFMPIYLQSVHGMSPVRSGVGLIPFLLPEIVAIAILGVIVRRWGHYVPYMVVGELIAVVGTALLTQLEPDTPTLKWAAYLVVAGVGIGMAMQLPYTAIQITLSDEDIPTGNGIAVFMFQLGGAIAISMGQTITITTIIDLVSKSTGLPGLSGEIITKAGAAGLRSLSLSPSQLAVLVGIWNEATKRTMILSVSLVAASLPFTLGMEWLNARKIAIAKDAKREKQPREEDVQEERNVDMREDLSKAMDLGLVERPFNYE